MAQRPERKRRRTTLASARGACAVAAAAVRRDVEAIAFETLAARVRNRFAFRSRAIGVVKCICRWQATGGRTVVRAGLARLAWTLERSTCTDASPIHR